MQIISMLSDWGSSSVYGAWAEAQLYRINEHARIVQLSNSVKTFELNQAAYLLEISLNKFPEGTIHINYVDCFPPDKHILIAELNKQYIITANNGFLGLLPQANKIYKFLSNESSLTYFNDVAEICNQIQTNQLGLFIEDLEELFKLTPQLPTIASRTMTGTIMYIDQYGNLHTNIKKDYFEKHIGRNQFKVFLRRHDTHSNIQKHYNDSNYTEIVAFFNSGDYLEIALNKQNASTLLGMNVGMNLMIEY